MNAVHSATGHHYVSWQWILNQYKWHCLLGQRCIPSNLYAHKKRMSGEKKDT